MAIKIEKLKDIRNGDYIYPLTIPRAIIIDDKGTTIETLIEGKEDKINKTSSITSSSTDIQYPTAKATYSAITGAVSPLQTQVTALQTGKLDAVAATSSTLGGIKVGQNLTIDSNGVLSAGNSYVLPTATSSVLGGVKVGSNLTIANGVLSAKDTTYSAATTANAGLMTAADKVKLNGIDEGANKYILPVAGPTQLGGIKVGQNLTIAADGTLSAGNSYVLPIASTTSLGGIMVGSNLTIDSTGKLSAVDTTYSAATTTKAGLMSADDKTKLNGIADNATKVESSTNGKIKINGTDTTVYTHPSGTTQSTQGLYKIKTDNGHVTAATAVAKSDITGLGIPGSVSIDFVAGTPTDSTGVDSVAVVTEYSDVSASTTGSLSTTATRVNVPSLKVTNSLQTQINGIEGKLSSGMHYKGTASAIPAIGEVGDVYKLTAALSNPRAEIGDFIVCRVSTTTSTPANWDVWQANLNGAAYFDVTVPTSGNFVVADGTNGKVATSEFNPGSFAEAISYDKTTGIIKLLSPNDILSQFAIPTVGSAELEYTDPGLMSSDDKLKLDGVMDGATRVESSTTNGNIKINGTDTTVYTHPSYTSKASGLYKIAVDGTGHVSAATAVVKSDITALGIPAQDTTYEDATTFTHGLMSAADKSKLDSLDNISIVTTISEDSTDEQCPSAKCMYDIITEDERVIAEHIAAMQSPASETKLGTVKVGQNLSITPDGTLNVTIPDLPVPVATASTLGGVKVGSGLDVTSDGTLSVSSDAMTEVISNKVTSLTEECTDIQYPSARCVYELVGNIEALLADL